MRWRISRNWASDCTKEGCKVRTLASRWANQHPWINRTRPEICGSLHHRASEFARRRACPAAKGAMERARLGVTKQVRYLGDRDLRFRQIAHRELMPHCVRQPIERYAFGR